MKIAFVSHPGYAVLPPAGSVEIGTREVAVRLAERHDVTIYGSASPHTRDTTDANIRYRFIAHGGDAKLARGLRPLYRLRPADRGFFASSLNSILYWMQVALDIRRGGFDVVHVANLTQGLPVIKRLDPGVRIVLHMHCEWLIQLDRGMVARRLRHADAIIGVSDHITDPIRRRFPEFASRCRTVYNGVELAEPVDRPRDPSVVTLLHVGRISPEKGHHDLVDALNAVVRTHPEIRLVLVGEESVIPLDWAVAISPDPLIRDLERFYSGSYLDQVKARMSPELAARTEFVGRIGHHETARHYAAADLFVFPSYFEAMPVPPIEAMAAGLPVITAPVGGAAESVVDGETGIYVERADPDALARAIAELVDDPDRRAELGDAGRERAEQQFSWEVVAAEFERAVALTAGPMPSDAAIADVVAF